MTKLGFNREFRLKQYHKIDHCTKMYLAFLLRMAVANFSFRSGFSSALRGILHFRFQLQKRTKE
jgi:hypothetical protein